jgi:hypothetical protein
MGFRYDSPIHTTPMLSPSLFPCRRSVFNFFSRTICLLCIYDCYQHLLNTMHVDLMSRKSKCKGSLLTGLELVTIFEAATEV